MNLFRWAILLAISLIVAGCGALNAVFGLSALPTASPLSVNRTPSALYMLRGDIAFPMDRGSYCWITLCVDVMPPTYVPEEHTWVIGHTLELLFDAPFPDTVTASLHPGSNLMTRVPDLMADAVMDENGRVLVTVPDAVDGNYVLVMSATWGEADGIAGDVVYTTPVRFGE